MDKTAVSPASQISEAFGRDGYWIAHGLFTGKECDELKAEALRLLREKSDPKFTVFVGASVASPLYRRYASDPRVVAILKQIMPDGVMFMSDKIVLKSGTQRFATPWHCDEFYWKGTRPKFSVWIPFDDATAANGTLTVVRGSHRRDWEYKLGEFSKTNNEFINVVDDAQWQPDDVVTCNLKRGGAVFFSDRLVHGSCENSSGQDRYTVITTYHAPAEDEEFDKGFPARHVIV